MQRQIVNFNCSSSVLTFFQVSKEMAFVDL